MSSAAVEESGPELKRSIVEFAQRASTEITTYDAELVPTLASRLMPGTIVYVAHTPKASLQEVVRVSGLLEGAGLHASPHIVARRIESMRTLREAADELADAGVARALVVAGDSDRASGPFSTAMDVLRSGVLTEAGIRRIGVAGHPEGHPGIGQTALWRALAEKQEYARQAAVRMHIVTQFGFDPAAVCSWEHHFGEHGITMPVFVGMAGPAPLPKMIRYAMQCGVGASLRGLMRSVTAMRNVSNLATSPDEMLVGLLRGCGGAERLAGPHFYSMGGALATATWLRAVADGNFELDPKGGRFRLSA
jgi:methylenetetrahydrofolate reductase (NADPH)